MDTTADLWDGARSHLGAIGLGRFMPVGKSEVPSMIRGRRSLRILAAAAVVSYVSAGCASGPKMDSNTICKDFLAASQTDRDEVVLRLAAEYHNPGVTTPLGRPDVEFNCTEKPDLLLGDVVRTSDNPNASSPPNS